MPDRRYRPGRVPPSVGDRFASHYSSVILSAWWALAGVGITLTALLDWPATSAFASTPDELSVPLGSAILVGGVGVLWSMLSTTRRLTLLWDVQQTSFIIACVAWLSYSVAVMNVDAWNWVSVGHGWCMTMVAASGFVVSKLAERAGREDIRESGGRA